MKVAGLFSGIGGLELPFREVGAETVLLCDSWQPSQSVLSARFPGIPIAGNIAELHSLPDETDVVTAGFPCTDLSQAGKTAGISGAESGLVSHVFRLLENANIEWLVLENVRNMLVLGKGGAMEFLTARLEELGFNWAYRLVDSRFAGVPQRRHRVLLVASRKNDPREVLFADEAGEPPASSFASDAFGFYWTEGLRGLGWARDSVPPLKGGSRVGIPSPPAIWIASAPLGRKIVTPSIESAEALQGFQRGWTSPAVTDSRRNGPRWKLVGNAVTVGVARWVAERLTRPGRSVAKMKVLARGAGWPDAAYGESTGRRWLVPLSHWPRIDSYVHLRQLLREPEMIPLSHRAAAGFLSRARRSSLRFDPAFLRDLEQHAEALAEVACAAGRLLEAEAPVLEDPAANRHALA